MLFLELALQGVRGCSPSARVALKNGYTVLTSTSGSPPLGALISALAFADGRGGDSAFAAPGLRARAAFLVQGNDQQVYRVIRELGGGGSLQKLDRATQQFTLITQDSSEATQFLRSQVGFVPRTSFEQLCCLGAAQLPSRRPKKRPTGAVGPSSKPPLAPTSAVAPAEDVPSAKARLVELERELSLSQEVDQLQSRVDELSSELYELETKVKGADGLRTAVQEAQSAHDRAPTPETLGVPADIVTRLDRYPKLVQRRDEALARLEVEREQAQAEEPPGAPEPLYRDRRFLMALGAGVICLFLGMSFDGYGRYIALMDIVPFGVAAMFALKWVEGLQAATRVGRKADFLVAREKKIHDEFERDARSVREALKAAQVESSQELLDLLSRKPLLWERLEDLRGQLTALESDPAYTEALSQHTARKEEHDRLSAALQQKGSYVRDVREVEREISRLKESIALAAAPRVDPPKAAASSSQPPGELEEFAPPLMKLVADLLGTDIPTAAGLMKDRSAQYLAALTDRRFHAVEIDREGRATLTGAAGQVPAVALPGRDADAVYLSLRLAAIEKFSARVKVPIIVEDVMLGVEEGKHGLLARMLKHLGTLTQVLHLTTSAAAAGVADASASL